MLAKIAATIRRLRESRGLTQEELAENAEIDVRQVQRAEAGKIDSGVTKYQRIADALEVDLGRLVQDVKGLKRGPRRA